MYTELCFSSNRSSGPGGQNVNKVNTKVELRFSVQSSKYLSDEEKQKLMEKLRNKINNDFELVLYSQTERTQLGNKNRVTEKFFSLLEKALTSHTPRKSTKPTFTSVEKRLEAKKYKAVKKELRNKRNYNQHSDL